MADPQNDPLTTEELGRICANAPRFFNQYEDTPPGDVWVAKLNGRVLRLANNRTRFGSRGACNRALQRTLNYNWNIRPFISNELRGLTDEQTRGRISTVLCDWKLIVNTLLSEGTITIERV